MRFDIKRQVVANIKMLFHYFFDCIEYKLLREKASTLKNMCDVQIFVNEVDKLSYYPV